MKVLAIRQATAPDLEFVVNSWVESYRLSHFSGPIPMPMYRDAMTAFVRWILQRPGIEVWVAFKPRESPPDDIYGWLAIERDVLMRVRQFSEEHRGMIEVERPTRMPVIHYAYVKQIFREHGVANRLCAHVGIDPRAGVVHTHKTAIVAKLQGLKKIPGAVFAPQLARFPKITKNEPKENDGGQFDEPTRP